MEFNGRFQPSSSSHFLSFKTSMSSIYRDIHSQLSVTIQLEPEANLNNKQLIPVHEPEKSLEASLENGTGHHHHHCEYGQIPFPEHHSYHNSNIQLRRFLLSVIVFVFVALGSLLAWSCVNAMPAWGFDLVGRALDDNLNSTSNQTRDTPPADGDEKKIGQLVPLAYFQSNHLRDFYRSPRMDLPLCRYSVHGFPCAFVLESMPLSLPQISRSAFRGK
jgi:hypothetical protein